MASKRRSERSHKGRRRPDAAVDTNALIGLIVAVAAGGLLLIVSAAEAGVTAISRRRARIGDANGVAGAAQQLHPPAPATAARAQRGRHPRHRRAHARTHGALPQRPRDRGRHRGAGGPLRPARRGRAAAERPHDRTHQPGGDGVAAGRTDCAGACSAGAARLAARGALARPVAAHRAQHRVERGGSRERAARHPRGPPTTPRRRSRCPRSAA